MNILMMLKQLIADIVPVMLERDVNITGLSLDSRAAEVGDLFFAIPGTRHDGREFIEAAIQNGVAAVLTESELIALHWRGAVPVISLPDLKTKMAEIAARFYAYPAKKMRMVGVTGTSGKTSCTQFIGAVLQQLNMPCGIVGTLGNGLYGNLHDTNLTTPDVITLQRTLAEFLQQGVHLTAMEVSSHSLDQGRVKGIEFEVGVFTNLTREHLDYHGTMEKYGQAKKQLFSQSKNAVINADDAFGAELIASLDKVISYSTETKNADVFVTETHMDHHGTQANIHTPWGKAELFIPLVGQFNLSNILAVISSLCLLEIPFATVAKCLRHIKPVPGRMQSLGGDDKPLVIVDYAHKPDALLKVLHALRKQCQGKLYCVFGCGGERDRGKRPMMAKIAEDYADQIIVTDDNPRHENPQQIMDDIMQGFSGIKKIIIEHDRSKAIRDTIQYATAGDCVLVAGKGAETYQIIGDQKIPFMDEEEIKVALDAK